MHTLLFMYIIIQFVSVLLNFVWSLSSTETGLSIIIIIVHKIIYLNTQDREMENERSWSEHVTQHMER